MTDENDKKTKHYTRVYESEDVMIFFRDYQKEEEE